MQWLIDLIIEKIGIPPVFIDRGDPATADFDEGDLIANDAWHDLDLSSITPNGAKGVCLYISMFPPGVTHYLYFRKKGNVNFSNISGVISEIAGVISDHDITVPLDADRKIEYLLITGYAGTLTITVKNWWL